VGSNLVSSNTLDGNGVKTMPGSIPAPKSGSLQKKIHVTKWAHQKNILKKKLIIKYFGEIEVEREHL